MTVEAIHYRKPDSVIRCHLFILKSTTESCITLRFLVQLFVCAYIYVRTYVRQKL